MHIMDSSTKKRAVAFSESGDCENLHKLIKPFIESEDLFALHLYANYSLESFNESDEEFAVRNIELLTKTSEGGVAEDSYRMGVNHLYGDDVEQSYEKAKSYFERAIAQGHSHTKFTYGFSLYYGTDQNAKNEARGLNLIKQANQEGIEMATVELAKISAKNA